MDDMNAIEVQKDAVLELGKQFDEEVERQRVASIDYLASQMPDLSREDVDYWFRYRITHL